MSLLDEARTMQRKAGSPCAMQRMKTQHPKIYADFVEALASDTTCTAIARAYASRKDPKTRPIPISRHMLERHRRGDCTWCR